MFLNKTVLFIIFSLCFSTANLLAQKKLDTLTASLAYKKADSLLSVSAFDKSITLFNKALTIYEKEKAWVQVSNCYDKLGRNFEKKFKYKEALKVYEKSYQIRKEKLVSDHPDIITSLSDLGTINYILSKYEKALYFFKAELTFNLKKFGEIHKKTGNAYNNIGLIYSDLGDLDIALKYLKKSLDIDIQILKKDHINIGFSYINIGHIYYQLKQPNKALDYYQKSLPSFLKNNYNKGTIAVYNNTGIVLESQGKLNKALEYYQKSIALTLENSSRNVPFLSKIYMNIGNIYTSLNKYDKAFFYLNKSLKNYKSILDENHYEIIKIYDNIGSFYTSKEDYNNALKYHEKALAVAEHIFDNNIDIVYSYQLLGNLKYKNNLNNEALLYYKKALKIIEEKYDTHYVLLSNFYFDLGKVYYKNKDYTIALEHFNKSLISNSKNKQYKNSPFNPDNYFDSQLLLKTLHSKAQLLNSQYNSTNSKKYLVQSNKIYNDADKTIDYLRQSYQNFNDKIHLAEQGKKTYANAISANLLSYKVTKNEKDLKKAFYYAEKSKSNILKDLLMNANPKKFIELPEEITDLETTLKSNRAFYQSQIASEQSKDSIDIKSLQKFENKLFSTNRSQDSLIKILEKKYPKHYQSKYNNKLISVKEIQNKINKQTTILEFFVTDSIIHAFTITKNTISIKELPVNGLIQKIENLNKALTSENTNLYKEIAHKLYNEILFPINKNIVGNQLVIIPDGALWHLNFDLLLTQKNTEQNNRNLPYLLKDYAISYANSAHLLFSPTDNKTKTQKPLKECLAFSFSDTSAIINKKTMSLATLRGIGDDLPGTREEIKAIADIVDGQYYYGSDADEATFKQNASKYSILHLAMHGEINNDKPQNSKLYFTKSKDTIEDNLLYSHELFALNIPADLVVLSACNTGSGKVANGEGLMSLGNAFQYAGAKSLLLSKWEVSDKTTPELMKYFYKNLKEGMTKAKALQQAKLKYLKTTETFYTNPYYWGSFYILGNTNSINVSNDFKTSYFWIFGSLLILLTLIIIKYKINQ